jgi:hypothetical protein
MVEALINKFTNKSALVALTEVIIPLMSDPNQKAMFSTFMVIRLTNCEVGKSNWLSISRPIKRAFRSKIDARKPKMIVWR